LARNPKVKVSADGVIINTKYEVQEDTPAPIYGFTIYGPNGINILENNTLRIRKKTEDLKKGNVTDIEWVIPNIFASGEYTISVACCNQSVTQFYDWVNEAASFNINSDSFTAGVVDPDVKIAKYQVK
jgi:hypothetical protein